MGCYNGNQSGSFDFDFGGVENSEKKLEKIGCVFFIVVFLAVGGYFVYKKIIKNKNNQPKTEQVQIKNNTGIKNAALYGNFVKTR